MSALNTFVFMTFPLNVSAARVSASKRDAPDGRERTKLKAVDEMNRRSPVNACDTGVGTVRSWKQQTTPRMREFLIRGAECQILQGKLRRWRWSSRCAWCAGCTWCARRTLVRRRCRSGVLVRRRGSSRRGSGVLIRRSGRRIWAVLVARNKECRSCKRGKYFQRLHLVTPMQAKMEIPYSGLETLD